MITPGMDCETKATPSEVAFCTVRTLSRSISAALPGVMFLSRGQSEEDASVQLNSMN